MKHVLFLLIFMLLPISARADWKVLPASKNGPVVELDRQRTQKLINNYVAVARTHLKDQQIEFKTEIDCLKKRHKLLYHHVFNKRGVMIHNSTGPKPWEQIVPDSIFDSVMREICTSSARQ